MSGFGIPFVEEVPEYAVRNEVVYVTIKGRALLAMPLKTFKLGIVRSAKAIEDYESGVAARVVHLRPKGSR